MPLHFATWKREDTPEARAYFRERLLSLSIPEPNTGCWLWMKGERHGGYGQIRHNGKDLPAHRLSYEIFVRPIPPEHTIDHLCRTPACINPDHLEAVPHRVNLLRRTIGILGPEKCATHCINGHPFSGDNLRVDPKTGRRCCRTCDREKQRICVARRKARETA